MLLFLIGVIAAISLAGCVQPPSAQTPPPRPVQKIVLTPAKQRLLERLIAEAQSGGHQDTFRGAEHQSQDEAAKQLLTLGEPGIEALLQLLKTGKSDGKMAAAKALSSRKGDPRVGPTLEKVLKHEETGERLAAWIRASLCRFGYHYEDHFIHSKRYLCEGSKESVTDKTGSVWRPFWDTLWAAAFIGDDNALQLVQNALKKYGKDRDPRCYVGALGDTRNPKATPKLYEYFRHLIMTSADSDKLGPKVRQAIEAEIQQVGRQLLIALGKCGGQWASIALSIEHPLFSKNDLAVALGELGTSEAFSLLRKLIEDNDFESGLNPYIALRSFDAEDSAQVLLKVLKNMEGKSADDIQWIVSHIVDYSRTVCDESLVPVLEKAYAMYSKAQPGELDTYTHVEMAQQLYFIDSTASRAALERLSRVGGPACVPPLLMLARDGLRDTSNALIAALKDIEDDQKWVECLELVGAELNPVLLPVVEFALKCSQEEYCEVWEHFLDCVFESVIEMPPDKTKDFMLRCLKEEFPPEVRQTFAKVLALRFKSPEAKPVLAGMYAEDKALDAAFLLLRSYGDTRGIDTLKAAIDKGKMEVHLWGEQNSYLFPSGLNDWIETQPLLDLPVQCGKELWRYAVERFIEVANKAALNQAKNEEIESACEMVSKAAKLVGKSNLREFLPLMKEAWQQYQAASERLEGGTGADIAAALHMLGDKIGVHYLLSTAAQDWSPVYEKLKRN
jgi:HEAT repeat protein